jgi:uncharacterized protein YdeI (YjbR/CyaY-like superfamily)
MNPQVDHYLSEGCGRCPLGGSPECKVHNWPQELKKLRTIVLECGLTEELKWGVPCYTFHNNNILIVSAFKEYSALSFLKGALLSDTNGILQKPGENTQATRLIKFTNLPEIIAMEDVLKAYIFEAIEVEKAGLEVVFKTNPEPVPDELQHKLDENSAFRAAFEALTQGRQRGYILHFSQPKQSATRESRIEKCIPKIMEGKGFNDR